MELPPLVTGLEPPAALAAGAVFALLGLVTVAVPIVHRLRPSIDRRDLMQRALGWWLVLGPMLLALLVGPWGVLVLFALASWLGLVELAGAAGVRLDGALRAFAVLALGVQYALVATGHHLAALLFIPLGVGLCLPAFMLLTRGAEGFVRQVGALQLAMLLAVTSLSQVPALMLLPGAAGFVAGGAGLVLCLLVLAQLNDVAQYYWGKLCGRTLIVPRLSPKKTWAGFLGGAATMGALGWWLTPALTPLPQGLGVLLGVAIACFGFLGDLTISAIKREANVKDLGTLLPGFGGVMDRLDSLIYVAPLFCLFMRTWLAR